MADADSLVDLGNSEEDRDLSEAEDADVDEDELSLDGNLAAGRHKKTHKKHKRKQKRMMADTTSDSEDNVPREEPYLNSNSEKPSQQSGQEPDTENTANVQKTVEMIGRQLQSMQLGASASSAPKSVDAANRKTYQFWDTQPVPKFNEKVAEEFNGPIEEDKPADQLRQTPLTLPAGFEWDTLEIDNPIILEELYTLLNENYVEDDDNMFRFDYSPGFLKWALQPPGWQKEWHCGVRVSKNQKLVGFISAVPSQINIYDKSKRMVEINFLCVVKKLRNKRVAPVLIREITRRVNCKGLFQAVYTAGVVLPRPVASCRYWHRSLNPKKLIEVKFSHLGRNMTMQRTLKLYRLPDQPQLPGFRKYTAGDLKATLPLVNEYLSKFSLAPQFTEEEFSHWFTPRDGIIESFVNETDGKVTDFISFYSLPSTIMHHPTYKTLRAAYSFYMAANKVTRTQLVKDALIIAKQLGFDVFNALDLMDNKEFLEELKFGVGDGNLQYYIYNWKCATMKPDQVGLVLQ